MEADANGQVFHSGGIVPGGTQDSVPVMLQHVCHFPLLKPVEEALEKLQADHFKASEQHRAELEAMPGKWIVGMDLGVGSDGIGCAAIFKQAPDGRLALHSVSLVPHGTQDDLNARVHKALRGMPYDVRIDEADFEKLRKGA